MVFLSLLLDLMWLFGGSAVDLTASAADSGVEQPAHTIHGHLPGPVDPHFRSTADHRHHGQHGHSTGGSGHEIFH